MIKERQGRSKIVKYSYTAHFGHKGKSKYLAKAL